MMLKANVLRIIKVFQIKQFFAAYHPLFREQDGAQLLVHSEVLFVFQFRNQGVDLHVQPGGVLGRTGNDQRGPGLVDQDGVHLVHDAEKQVPLDQVLHPELHVVPQIIKAELIVRAVGHVGVVGRLALRIGQPVEDHPDFQPQKTINPAHPLRVAAGQIVVDRDHVHALAGQGVEHHRQGRGQGLALAGLHFGDLAVMEHHTTDQLGVKVAHLQSTPGSLAHQGEGLGQQIVQGPTILGLLLPLPDLGRKVVVTEPAHPFFMAVDGRHHRLELFQVPLILGADDLLDDKIEHAFLLGIPRKPWTQGICVLEARAFWISIEIEIAIEIGKLPEIDFDHDFDFDFDFDDSRP